MPQKKVKPVKVAKPSHKSSSVKPTKSAMLKKPTKAGVKKPISKHQDPAGKSQVSSSAKAKKKALSRATQKPQAIKTSQVAKTMGAKKSLKKKLKPEKSATSATGKSLSEAKKALSSDVEPATTKKPKTKVVAKKLDKKEQRLLQENQKKWKICIEKLKICQLLSFNYQAVLTLIHLYRMLFLLGLDMKNRNHRLEVIFKDKVRLLLSNYPTSKPRPISKSK